MGKRVRLGWIEDYDEMSGSRSIPKSEQRLIGTGIRERLGERGDLKEDREDDTLQFNQEDNIVKLKQKIDVLREEWAISEQNQQLRDQTLQDEKDSALRAGAQINEKNMELEAALKSITEEKKNIERDRDEAISGNMTLKKEVDDLKKKHEDTEALLKEKCQKYKEVAAKELEKATKTLASYKEMLTRSKTTLKESDTRLAYIKDDLDNTKKELASAKDKLDNTLKELAEVKLSTQLCPDGHRMTLIPQTDKSWHCDLCKQQTGRRGLRCEVDERWRRGGTCSYSICQERCEDGASLRSKREMKKRLRKEKKRLEEIQIQVESLEAENHRMKEEIGADNERTETYERTIGEQEKKLESYKREMKKNEELVEQTFVEREALVQKNSCLRSKIKKLQRILQE